MPENGVFDKFQQRPEYANRKAWEVKPLIISSCEEGLDIASESIGVSSGTGTRELFAAEAALGNEVKLQAHEKITGEICKVLPACPMLGKKYFITGKRTSDCFDLKTLDGTTVNNSAIYLVLQLTQRVKVYIFGRRMGVSSLTYAVTWKSG